MNSHATERFWKLVRDLPQDIRVQAYKVYAMFRRDPSHPSVHFEQIDRQSGLWSAQINDRYRVLGVRNGGDITWFWIGNHGEYDKIIRRK
jgi:hypothetical protein